MLAPVKEEYERISSARKHTRHTMAQRRAMNGRIAFLSHDRLHLAVEDSDQLASGVLAVARESNIDGVRGTIAVERDPRTCGGTISPDEYL